MQKQAPTLGKLAVICGFAISCIGILIYLWVTFGGSIPLEPTGYRIKVPFDEATQLTPQADVRVSGISEGKVASIGLTPDGRHALATLNIDPQYAPIPADTRAILRGKTLLGETYVELTPGDQNGPKLAENATLPYAQVDHTVELDEILRTFSPKTRAGFQAWMQNAAIAIKGRGTDLSNAIAELQPTFDGFDSVFRTLDTEQQAVSQLFANGATTFNALAGRQNALANLITSGNTTFNAIGRRNEDLSAAFRAFPHFLDESTSTFDRLRSFALDADPLMRQLIPAAKKLSPTFIQIAHIAPAFRTFFTGLKPTAQLAPTGFPAFQTLAKQDFPPLLVALDPFLRSLNPIIDGIGQYKHEVTSLFANATAALNGTLPGSANSKPHYIRTLVNLNPETAAAYPKRLTTERSSAYMADLAYSQLFGGLSGFETRQCTSGINAKLDPTTPTNADFNSRFGTALSQRGDSAADFFNRLQTFAFAGKTQTNDVPTPNCNQQGQFAPLGAPGAATSYQHALRQTSP